MTANTSSDGLVRAISDGTAPRRRMPSNASVTLRNGGGSDGGGVIQPRWCKPVEGSTSVAELDKG